MEGGLFCYRRSSLELVTFENGGENGVSVTFRVSSLLCSACDSLWMMGEVWGLFCHRMRSLLPYNGVSFAIGWVSLKLEEDMVCGAREGARE